MFFHVLYLENDSVKSGLVHNLLRKRGNNMVIKSQERLGILVAPRKVRSTWINLLALF